jgi:3-oxoacyl-[acyl-carrier protein] reductase
MDMGIRGKKAIVAGGSAGMGKAAALALAREGAELVILARGLERLLAAANEITAETGSKVTAVVGDHSTAVGREALLRACPEPDILVITSGPPRMLSGYDDASEQDWLKSFQTTLMGPIELMKATVAGMADRGFGRVVNIGTVAAKTPVEARLLSGPMRSALCNYTGAVARRVAPQNVAINNILPGMFHTAGSRELFERKATATGTNYDLETQRWSEESGIPAARFGDAEDVGALCALLCSRYASYVIGQAIVIDGGLMRSVF